MATNKYSITYTKRKSRPDKNRGSGTSSTDRLLRYALIAAIIIGLLVYYLMFMPD
jgi:hypothetical protein